MERVAFLIEETGERIPCLLNPETLAVRRLAGVASRRSAGGTLNGAELSDDPLIFTGGGTTEMTFDLLFDISMAEADRKIKDVRELTSPLWNLTENAGQLGTFGKPARVRFVWGKSWNIEGIVAAVSEHFDHFDAAGVPLRSWLRMRFLRAIEPIGETDAKAPPLTLTSDRTPEQIAANLADASALPTEVKVHTFAAGERLDQLVRQEYGYLGHPAMWRLIASYNSIDDPLNIQAGTVLQFPPLSVFQENE